MSDTIVKFNNVCKYFGGGKNLLGHEKKLVKAVDNVSFEIERGKTFAVIGESGSGKTTMAKLLMKFEIPTKGSITLDGKDISTIQSKTELKKYRQKVQIVHQDPTSSLNPRKTLKEIIEEPLIVHQYGDKDSRLKLIRELMDVVHLPQSFLERYPHMLSGGQKQRIGIARAIALKSPIIILDEPTSALDVSVQSRVIELLQSIKEQYNITYFFITHDLALVKNFADDVIILQQGNLVEHGTVDEIFRNPKRSYTKKLLKAIAVVNPEEQAFLDRISIED